MSLSKNYDDNKKNVQLISNLVEDLNDILYIENASVDRLLSRLNQTPIQEIKQRLKQHMEETLIQKSKLQRIITELGGKPTNAKSNLSGSSLHAATVVRILLRPLYQKLKITIERILH